MFLSPQVNIKAVVHGAASILTLHLKVTKYSIMDLHAIRFYVSGRCGNKEREVSWNFDIGHWTFECPMSNIEYPANFTFLWKHYIFHFFSFKSTIL